jgi:hypothetical protein
MTIVVEGRARAGADEAEVDGVEVVHAPGVADDTIVAIVDSFGRGGQATSKGAAQTLRSGLAG